MLKDITVILVDYSDQAMMYKALISLKKISSRLKHIMVFKEPKMTLNEDHGYDWFDQVEFINTSINDPGQILNDTIDKLDTPYVLFLNGTDYLSPTISVDDLHLPHQKSVLGTLYHNRNIVIHRPLLVSTSLLKEEKFLSIFQLPLKDALFPAWLSNVEASRQLMKDDLVKQSNKNSSTSIIEREKIIQKYQLKKIKTKHPTISILISNYNMGKYVEAAVASCLLQSEQSEQLLIIDDGSTDNSYQQLRRWDDKKRVKLFNKKNEGKAKALNELLPHVTSEFILELDADDWLDPDAVSVIKKNLSDLPKEVAVLYGNLRKWKQLTEDVLFKGISKGVSINGTADLLSYRFPLGPRVYRTSTLKEEGGFPVIEFENGRLYEDVSVLNRLIKNNQFCYRDFTVYNVREHNESITRNNYLKWEEFFKTLNTD
ncbi:glycosyltransferase family 2 protein [Lentibacillus sediminis]|uniref:glycosyltransferase family 2 protein n=1 Tax=Lentibacillus sediminis TaxID=1940529 RepID=UPI001EFD50AE|nr:glycosyltransferase family A protein [Lentibacillus sediminis]